MPGAVALARSSAPVPPLLVDDARRRCRLPALAVCRGESAGSGGGGESSGFRSGLSLTGAVFPYTVVDVGVGVGGCRLRVRGGGGVLGWESGGVLGVIPGNDCGGGSRGDSFNLFPFPTP
jgi:hypothetical protein